MPDYVFDTTVLSNFAAVGRLDLLRDRYHGRAFTTLDVADELRKGVNAGYAYLELVLVDVEPADQESWIRMLVPQSTSERRLRARFDERLDAGEASCLALAVTRKLTLVTDDKAARQLARTQSVPVAGTVGILIQLVRNSALSLSEANALLADMLLQRYRAPVDRLDELV
jgi:predicted nucleic acid-binding protein